MVSEGSDARLPLRFGAGTGGTDFATVDLGDLSLREALFLAALNPGSDAIAFDLSLGGGVAIASQIGASTVEQILGRLKYGTAV